MNNKQRLALIATIIGSGIVIVDSTVVNIALPHISDDLGSNFSGLQWIVDGYLLTLSALILLGGSLGDILGRKKVYQTGLVGFGITSLLCGLSPNTTFLIVMRILQGVFGALLVPGGLANINANFEKSQRAGAIGTWTAWSALSAALGPLLGGYIVDSTSWRWIFIINVPLVALCFVLAQAGLKETRDTRTRRIDFSGSVLAAASLGGITFGLIEGPVRDWDVLTLGSLALGALFAALFLRQEKRQRDPMVEFSLFKSRNFTGANLMTLAMYGALGGFIFSLVIYLQSKLGYSGTKAGLSLLPITVMLLLLSSRVGKLAGKYGARPFMTAGPILSGIGILLFYNLGNASGYISGVLPGMVLFALGLAITVSPLTITVMSSVSDESSGIASGINNAVSRVAGLIVVAVLGVFNDGSLFKASILLCGILAMFAGVLSFILIRTPQEEV